MLKKIRRGTLHRITFPIIIAAMASGLFACAAPKVKQAVLMPANANAMVNARKIAVMHFHGDRHEEFTREVEYFFANIRVDNQPYFHVVDHDAMQAIIENQFIVPQQLLDQAAQLEESADLNSVLSAIESIAKGVSRAAPGLKNLPPPPGIHSHGPRGNVRVAVVPDLPNIDLPRYVFKPADALTLGQLSGADTILTGVVKWPRVERSHYTEERSQCVKTEESKSALTPGIKSKKCVQYEKHKVPCTKQVSNIEYIIKAVNVDNSEIAFTKRYAGSAENKFCQDNEQNNKISSHKLSEQAITNAIGKMRHDVAPYTVVLTINLMKKDDSQMAKNEKVKSLVDEGLSFARHGRLDRACDNFNRAEQLYQQSPAIYYNLGVCAEIKNELDEALQLYSHADSLTTKHNRTIDEALYRVKDRQLKAEQVAEQMH